MSRSSAQTLSPEWRSALVEVASETGARRPWVFWSDPLVFVTLLLSAVTLSILVSWQLDLQWQASSLSAKIRQVEHDDLTLSVMAAEAERAGGHYDAYLQEARLVTEKWSAKGWTTILRSLATDAGRNIALHRIRIYEKVEGSREYVVELSGAAFGREPRAEADRFQRRFRAALDRSFRIAENGQFELMEAPASATESQVAFTFATHFSLK